MWRAVTAALLLSQTPVTIWAASIGLFSDPACGDCNLSVPPGQMATFYVAALPLGFEPSRPDGAEFRVAGLPSEWQATVQPNPQASIVIGDPLGAGTNIAFSTGQPGSCVTLFTVQVLATTAASEITLQVLPHSTPSNPNFVCPVMVMDWIAYTRVCVDGGSMFVNSTRVCSVSLQPATWTALKRLYD